MNEALAIHSNRHFGKDMAMIVRLGRSLVRLSKGILRTKDNRRRILLTLHIPIFATDKTVSHCFRLNS